MIGPPGPSTAPSRLRMPLLGPACIRRRGFDVLRCLPSPQPVLRHPHERLPHPAMTQQSVQRPDHWLEESARGEGRQACRSSLAVGLVLVCGAVASPAALMRRYALLAEKATYRAAILLEGRHRLLVQGWPLRLPTAVCLRVFDLLKYCLCHHREKWLLRQAATGELIGACSARRYCHGASRGEGVKRSSRFRCKHPGCPPAHCVLGPAWWLESMPARQPEAGCRRWLRLWSALHRQLLPAGGKPGRGRPHASAYVVAAGPLRLLAGALRGLQPLQATVGSASWFALKFRLKISQRS